MNGCILDVWDKGVKMKHYIISEERLKSFIRHEKELNYAYGSVFYSPSNEELEATEEDLEELTEIKEHEYVPDIDFDFNSANDKKRVPVEIVRTVKFEPDFSDINND